METEHLITLNSIFPSFHFLASLMEREVNNFPLVTCFRNVKVPNNLLFSCSSYITITQSGWLNGPSRGISYYYILKIIQIREEYTYQGYLFHDLYSKWLFFNPVQICLSSYWVRLWIVFLWNLWKICMVLLSL